MGLACAAGVGLSELGMDVWMYGCRVDCLREGRVGCRFVGRRAVVYLGIVTPPDGAVHHHCHCCVALCFAGDLIWL